MNYNYGVQLEGHDNFVDGLNLTRTGASTVAISTGSCRDSTNSDVIEVTATINLDMRIVGSATGIISGTQIASAWYCCWLLKNSTTKAVTGILDLSFSNPTSSSNISGFDLKKRVGSVYQDANADIQRFHQSGPNEVKIYSWDTSNNPVEVLSGGNATATTSVGISATAPPSNMMVMCTLQFTNAASVSSDSGYVTGPSWNQNAIRRTKPGILATNHREAGIPILTKGSQSIGYQVTDGNDSLDIIITDYYELL